MTFKRGGARGSTYSKKLNPVVLYIAYEGAMDEDEYFKALSGKIPKQFSRYMQLVPVEKSSTASQPLKVYHDLNNYLIDNKIKLNNDLNMGFIVIDKDHHFSGSHQRAMSECISLCSQKGIEIICSNPCFDLWILCHYINIYEESDAYKLSALENKDRFLKKELGRIRNMDDIHMVISRSRFAIANAKLLENSLGDPCKILPEGLQTNVVKIFDLFQKCGIPLPM